MNRIFVWLWFFLGNLQLANCQDSLFIDFEDFHILTPVIDNNVIYENKFAKASSLLPVHDVGKVGLSLFNSTYLDQRSISVIDNLDSLKFGNVQLYHSAIWPDVKKAVGFDHLNCESYYDYVEIELKDTLPANVWYQFSIDIGSQKQFKFKPEKYGFIFSSKKLIGKTGMLLSNPDVLISVPSNHLETKKAFYYSKSPIKFMYSGVFSENKNMIEQPYFPYHRPEIDSTLWKNENCQNVKKTRIVYDNLLLKKIRPGELYHVDSILFQHDKTKIEKHEEEKLNEVSDFMKENPTVHIVCIGSADIKGSSSYNIQLSKRRAESVKKKLLQRGIVQDRIETRFIGEQHSELKEDKRVDLYYRF